MSVSRIILSIVIITYAANASLFPDRSSDVLPSGPYFDTLGDYYVEDPLAEALSAQTDSEDSDSDYEQNEWDSPNDLFGRQLPESGDVKLNPAKKSQIWCKVKKVLKHHYEPGYEFFPKSYSEYDCVPHTNSDGFSENRLSSSDICAVKDVRCKPLQKTFVFFKWPLNTKSFCPLIKVEKTVSVGCNCVNHVKYHFL